MRRGARFTNLVPPLTGFFGRDLDLQRLHTLIGSGEAVVTLFGGAGAGKTRLAMRFGELFLDDFATQGKGGVWFCDLTDARTLDGVLSAVGRALDFPLMGGRVSAELLPSLGRAIAEMNAVLIILDNCEQVVLDVARAITTWREIAPRAQFLATSRELMRIRDERAYAVLPLKLPAEGTDIAHSDAVQLFVDRAARARPGYVLTDADARTVAAIVHHLEGMPLAIELAASRMNVLNPSSLLKRLENRFELLARTSPDRSKRQRTLHDAVEWSWDLLRPWEQAGLAQCATFRGGFTLEAAEAVLALSAYPQAPRTIDVIQALCDKSLIRTYAPENFAEEIRFGLYESIREFTAIRLDAMEAFESLETRDTVEETEVAPSTVNSLAAAPLPASASRANPKVDAAGRHSAYYRRLAAELALDIDRDDGTAFLRLQLEMANLLAIQEHAVRDAGRDAAGRDARCDTTREERDPAGNPDLVREALAALLALAPVFGSRGPCAAYVTRISETLALPGIDRVPTSLKGEILVALSFVRQRQADLAGSILDAEAALDLAHATQDLHLQALAGSTLALALMQTGNLSEAYTHLNAALVAARASGDRWQQGLCMLHLGLFYQGEGRLDLAHHHFVDALTRCREVGAHRYVANILVNLGTVLHELGDFDRAQAQYDEAEPLYRRLNNQRGVHCVEGYRARLDHELGDLPRARDRYQRVVHMLREIGDQSFEALFLGGLGSVLSALGDIDGARKAFHRAETELAQTEVDVFQRTVAVHKGHLDLALSLESARTGDSERALYLRRRAEERIESAQTLALQSDDVRFALRLLQRALEPSTTKSDASSRTSLPPDDLEHQHEDALVVASDASWFRPPHGDWVSLRTRKSVRLLLEALAKHRSSFPGEITPSGILMACAWPGEHFMAKTGYNRLYVSLSALRHLGMKDLIVNGLDGYFIDPAVPFVFMGEHRHAVVRGQ